MSKRESMLAGSVKMSNILELIIEWGKQATETLFFILCFFSIEACNRVVKAIILKKKV